MSNTPLTVVFTKSRKFQGVVQSACATEYLVAFNGKGKNASIAVYEDKKSGITHCKDFKVGDSAEYDSYNLSYHGIIVAITEKTISITKSRNPSANAQIHRLSIHEFCWRNKNFDLVNTQSKNNDEMMYL